MSVISKCALPLSITAAGIIIATTGCSTSSSPTSTPGLPSNGTGNTVRLLPGQQLVLQQTISSLDCVNTWIVTFSGTEMHVNMDTTHSDNCEDMAANNSVKVSASPASVNIDKEQDTVSAQFAKGQSREFAIISWVYGVTKV